MKKEDLKPLEQIEQELFFLFRLWHNLFFELANDIELSEHSQEIAECTLHCGIVTTFFRRFKGQSFSNDTKGFESVAEHITHCFEGLIERVMENTFSLGALAMGKNELLVMETIDKLSKEVYEIYLTN
jgi:hypothetical protein